MQISTIKPNPNNPRLIKDDKFKKLVKSLQDFPEMMAKRPMVCVTDVDGSLYPLGGNMRLKALQELKYKDIPDGWVMMADDWTEGQRREFLIKDNVGYGEWDYEELANNWDSEQLTDWGVGIPGFDVNAEETDYSEKNKEIDLNEFEEKMEFKLKLTSDEFFDLQERLSVVKSKQNVNTNEQAIFELLNIYEATA